MRRFTTCLVASTDTSYERAALVAFLNTPPEAVGAGKLGDRVARADCLYASGADSVELRFAWSLLRGSLFRALYLDRKRPTPAVSFQPGEIRWEWTAGSGTAAFLQRIGDCVVAGHHDQAEALMSVEVGSRQEDSTVSLLAPAVAGCLDQGLNAQFSRITLEGILAEALYRQTSATSVVATRVAN